MNIEGENTMKRTLCLILTFLLVMSLAAPAALADSVQADTVTVVSDDTLVLHSQGLDITLSFPFGWKVFGQDYSGQMDDYRHVSDYQSYFTDAADMINFMIENELHLLAEPYPDNLFYLEIVTDNISTKIGNLNTASNATANDLLNAMKAGNTDATVNMETFGPNRVLIFEWSDQILYEIIVEGKMLDFRIESDTAITADEKADMAYIMSKVSLGAPQSTVSGKPSGAPSGWTTVRPGGSSAPKTSTEPSTSTADTGFLGALTGKWSEETYYIRGNQWTHAFLLDSTVYDCVSLTLDFKMTEYTGYPWGSWYLYARDLNGNWAHIGEFDIAEGSLNQTVTHYFTFAEPESFDALAFQSRVANEFTIGWSTSFYDARVQVS